MFIRLIILIIVSLGFLNSCGGGNTAENPQIPESNVPPPVSSGTGTIPVTEFYDVLMMGNSHTSPLPNILYKIFAVGQPAKSAEFRQAPGGMYLIDRANDTANTDLLASKRWSHLILQALKYSSSGTIDYSTAGAEYFINSANSLGIIPILYPEHPTRGNTWESDYLFQLHSSVAMNTGACVAPVGFVWEDVMQTVTSNLYHVDGNHASATGAFLTSLVLYHVISAGKASDLAFIPDVDVAEHIQEIMKASVDRVAEIYPACAHF